MPTYAKSKDQPLALDPAWASKLLGSSLDPDDQAGVQGLGFFGFRGQGGLRFQALGFASGIVSSVKSCQMKYLFLVVNFSLSQHHVDWIQIMQSFPVRRMGFRS